MTDGLAPATAAPLGPVQTERLLLRRFEVGDLDGLGRGVRPARGVAFPTAGPSTTTRRPASSMPRSRSGTSGGSAAGWPCRARPRAARRLRRALGADLPARDPPGRRGGVALRAGAVGHGPGHRGRPGHAARRLHDARVARDLLAPAVGQPAVVRAVRAAGHDLPAHGYLPRHRPSRRGRGPAVRADPRTSGGRRSTPEPAPQRGRSTISSAVAPSPVAVAIAAVELAAGADGELAVDVAQVVLDGLRAEEERGRGLAGRPAVGQQQRDLQLLRRQLVDACSGRGGARSRRSRRARRGRRSAHGAAPRRSKSSQRGAQLLAGVGAPARRGAGAAP